MSVNKVILLGNVGKDPEVRDVSGTKVASFTLATTDNAYTKSDGTQVPKRTEWHNIVAWRRNADVCENYVRKGTKLYIEGSLHTRSWDGRDGVKHYVTEIVVDKLELLTPKQGGQQTQPYQPQPQPQPAPQQYQQPQPQYQQPQPQYQQPAQPAPLPGQQPYQQQYQQPQQPQYQQPVQQYDGPGAKDVPF